MSNKHMFKLLENRNQDSDALCEEGNEKEEFEVNTQMSIYLRFFCTNVTKFFTSSPSRTSHLVP